MTPCSTIKTLGRGRKQWGGAGGGGGVGGVWEHSTWWHLASQVTVTCAGALLSWKWMNACLLMESCELFSYFALLVCMASDLPIKLSSSLLMSLLAFTLLILPPGEEWARGCVELSCHLRLENISTLETATYRCFWCIHTAEFQLKCPPLLEISLTPF